MVRGSSNIFMLVALFPDYLTSVYTHAVFRTLDSINFRSAAKGESVFMLI